MDKPQGTRNTSGCATHAVLHYGSANPKAKTDPPSKDHDSKESRAHSHIERTLDDLEQEDESDEYHQPTLWWFTSTAFPLIAGTFGPLANLFSICALVQTWRVIVPDGRGVSDPPWLLALNIISLVLALSANLLLFFNFARRVPYKIAQPFTIGLWYLSCILLTVPLALAHTILLKNHTNYTLSESYYCALIAAVLYFIISTLLLFNILGAYTIHAYPPSLGSLTIPHRTLMLQNIAFSCYLVLGAGVFSTIEGWGFIDGLYWADYTLLTIGLGSDFPLKRTVGRMLLFPYAAIGITSVGLIITSVRGLVLERGKAQITKRRLGKERERWEMSMNGGRDSTSNPDGVRLVSLCSCFRRKKWRSMAADFGDVKEQRVWGREEYELMRYIESSAKRSQEYIALTFSIVVFAVVWGGGAIVFWQCQREDGWSYPESLYFTYVALLTIGYGDLYPSTNASRPFFVIWSLVAVPAMTVLISIMGETIIKWIEEATVWLGQRSIFPERIEKRRTRRRRSHKRNEDTATATTARARIHPEHRPGDVEEVKQHSVEETTDDIIVEERERVEPTLAVRLTREITQVARDASNSLHPPRYEWNEWVRWLKMMEEVRLTLGESVDGATQRRGDGFREWTWLEDQGPLFSTATETQWLLGRLCQLLEKLVSERGEPMGGRERG